MTENRNVENTTSPIPPAPLPPATRLFFHDTIGAVRRKLEEIYARLYAHYGPQHWWPGDSRWEVMVGAILTQNTSWRNVEKALANLKRAGRLDPASMRRTRQTTLARLIRPSGYYNLKAKKLKALVEFLYDRCGGDPARLVRVPPSALRAELLQVYGIGPETADSILLYAADRPVFVVDAYTRRICARLGLASESAGYEDLQRLFMEVLPADREYFRRYNAKSRRGGGGQVSRERAEPDRPPKRRAGTAGGKRARGVTGMKKTGQHKQS